MPEIWPKETIRELLALAEATGESRARCETEEAAKRFRFAIYSFRASSENKEKLTITLDGTDVIITKVPPGPSVQILRLPQEVK